MKKRKYKEAKEHPNAHMKHRSLMIFFFVVVVLGIVILLWYNQGKTTGKAFGDSYKGNYPAGYYWENTPIEATPIEAGVVNGCNAEVVNMKISDGTTLSTDDSKKVCCPSNACLGDINDQTKGYCFDANSIYKNNYLCGSNYVWFLCDSKNLLNNKLFNEDKFFCSDNKWLVCKEKGVINELNALYCDGVKFKVCDDKSNLQLSKDNQYVCMQYSSKFQWVACDKEGSSINSAALCYGSIWSICDLNKNNVNVNNKYVCDGSKWVECANKFCSLDVLNVVKDFLNMIGGGNIFSSLPKDSKIIGKSSDPTNEVELGSTASINSFYAFLGEGFNKTAYFAFKEKTYTIELVKEDAYNGYAELVVKSVSGEIKGPPIKLELSPDNPTYFPAKIVSVDLDGDGKNDVYIQLFGYFLNKKAKIGVVGSAIANFDVFDEGYLFLSSGNTQNFIFNNPLDKPHTIKIIKSGGEGFDKASLDNFILFIDDKQYTMVKSSNSFIGTHYFDVKKTQQLFFEVLKVYDNYVVVHLSKTTQGVTQSYEAYFTKLESADIGGGMVFKVCEQDEKILPTVSVCNQNEEVKMSLYDKKVKEEGNHLFWYTQPLGNVGKRPRAFYLVDLKAPNNQEASVFANNLVDGRRLALKLSDKYYLLMHTSGQAYLNIQNLSLVEISNSDMPVYLAEGTQEGVMFNLPLGQQIKVDLNLKTPLSYDIKGAVGVVNTVDLEKELQARVSTYGKVVLTNPNVNATVDSKDVTLSMDKMKINYDNDPKKTIELSYNKPYVESNQALFYYNKFSVTGANTFIKYADIYLYSDLSSKPASHNYNNQEFILPIVKGNKMAFGLEGDYYLLGYSESWDPLNPTGFSKNKLQLTNLGTGEIYSATVVDENKILFELGKRRIELTFDSNNENVKFEGVIAIEVAKKVVDFEKDYAMQLPPGNEEVRNLLDVVNYKVQYYNCDTASTKMLKDFFLLCDESDKDKPMQIDMNLVKDYTNFIVWYKASQSGEKNIWFQKEYDLTGNNKKVTFNDWNLTVTNLINKQNPVIKLAKDKEIEYYELNGGKELSTFKLKKVPTGEEFTIQMQSIKDGYNNGTIAVGDRLVFFKQSLENYNIKLDVSLLSQKLVTNDWVNVTGAVASIDFSTEVGGQGYVLIVSKQGSFVKVDVYEKSSYLKDKTLPPFFSTNMVVGASKKVLLSNGDIVMIELLSIPSDAKLSPVVAIKNVS